MAPGGEAPASEDAVPAAPSGEGDPAEPAPGRPGGRGVGAPDLPDLEIDPDALDRPQCRLPDEQGPDFGGHWERCLAGGGYEIGMEVSDPSGVAWVSGRWEPTDHSQPSIDLRLRHADGETWIAAVRSTTHEGWMRFVAEDSVGNRWTTGFLRGAESPRCV